MAAKKVKAVTGTVFFRVVFEPGVPVKILVGRAGKAPPALPQELANHLEAYARKALVQKKSSGEPLGACTNPARDCARDSDCPEHGRNRPGQGATEHPNARHLKLVLVLTELEKAGKPVTLLSLCTRLQGGPSEVSELVSELVRREKVKVTGEWIELVAGDG